MKQDLYIRIIDEIQYKSIVVCCMISPWMFSFPNRIVPLYQEVKKYYHGNNKLLMHLFFNDITGSYEMQVTTESTEKSYPHINSLHVVDWESVNYDFVASIFGDPDGGK